MDISYKEASDIRDRKQETVNNHLTEIKERLGVTEHDYEGVKLALGSGVDIASPEVKDIVTAFKSKSSGKVHCYLVGYENNHKVPWMDTVATDNSPITQSNHCINFGNGLIVDMSNDVGSLFNSDILILKAEGTQLESYVNLAETVYGGDWNYLGNGGYEEMMRIQGEAIARGMAKYPELND